jgi:ribosomal protein L11 methyltransferase
MSWLELSVHVSRQNAPLVESLLQNEPVLALTLTDAADNPVLEPGVGETPLWPSVCVTALFSGDTPVDSLSRILSLVPGVERPQQVNFRKFEDQQWARLWMDRFKPMRFGHGLWIVPADQEVPAGATHVLKLEPGLAFGTGTHPTTRLCLQWMDGHDFQGQTVVDYGCGSGVLGIVAAIKGAANVICVDNDPQALAASGENAARNDVAAHIQTLMPAQFKPVQADVVLANILAGPLIGLAAGLLATLRPGGSLVLSGILEEQAQEVAAAYRAHIDHLTITADDGWARLQGRKTGPDSFNQGEPR